MRLTKNLLVAIVLGLLWNVSACQPGAAPETAEEPVPEESAESTMNTLTAAEEMEGWQLLFDGESLEHWRGFRMDSVPPGWETSEGTLYFTGEHGGEGYGDLTTKEQFADFELRLDWKLSPGGNSGILFRVSEDYEQEFMTGPEYQLLDDSAEQYQDLAADRFSGANYGLHAPEPAGMANPAGEWNSTRLVVHGPHVEHWLNGQKVVEYELWTDEWKAQVAETKFSEWPDYGMNETGHIVLQDHGAPIWFRNVKVKVLSALPEGS